MERNRLTMCIKMEILKKKMEILKKKTLKTETYYLT